MARWTEGPYLKIRPLLRPPRRPPYPCAGAVAAVTGGPKIGDRGHRAPWPAARAAGPPPPPRRPCLSPGTRLGRLLDGPPPPTSGSPERPRFGPADGPSRWPGRLPPPAGTALSPAPLRGVDLGSDRGVIGRVTKAVLTGPPGGRRGATGPTTGRACAGLGGGPSGVGSNAPCRATPGAWAARPAAARRGTQPGGLRGALTPADFRAETGE